MPGYKLLTEKTIQSLLTGAFCLFMFLSVSAQNADSVKAKKQVHPYPNPSKAMLYSAVLPGLGQAYNKRYWKMPIIYAGLGVAIYFIGFNQHYYNNFINAETDTKNPYYGLYSEAELSNIITFYHRDRDLSVIITAGIWVINIIDANVDAQLHGFNVSDDISLNFSPNLIPNPLTGSMVFAPGFLLVKKL